MKDREWEMRNDKMNEVKLHTEIISLQKQNKMQKLKESYKKNYPKWATLCLLYKFTFLRFCDSFIV